MLNTIADIIGIAGFVISLANIIYYLFINKKKLIFNFGDFGFQDFYKNQKLFIIHYRIDNLSQKPIAITRLQILINGTFYESEPREHNVEHTTYTSGNDKYHESFVDSKFLPINLDPLASDSGYFAFAIPRDNLSDSEKFLTFRICTNRGKAIQKTFALHEDVKCS